MSLSDDLKKEIAEILKEQWVTKKSDVVPANDDLRLSNDGIKLDASVLYADLADSTNLVNTEKSTFAAGIYKSFLRCACKLITNNSGIITAFDGDRVMGVFIGGYKNTNAVKTALKIKYAVTKIINPAIKTQYNSTNYFLTHGVGIDTSELLVARTGLRGSNDLVWIGPSANYAAKLAAFREDPYSTLITKNVFDNLNHEGKYSGDGTLMWEQRNWAKYNKTVYRSSYHWSF